VDLNRAEILPAYNEIERVVEAETYQPYRDVLAECALLVAARLGWSLPREHAGFLSRSLPEWKPFPETNTALERLKDLGYQLGILSNVDDELLAKTLRHFTVNFDLLVTAEQVGSYKPAEGHFQAARQRIGNLRWLHAAQSNFHDVVPARRLGIPVAWINRNKEIALTGGKPDYEFSSLAEFVRGIENLM
jgi:2-haloalkanoic acid dehalogenase type II